MNRRFLVVQAILMLMPSIALAQNLALADYQRALETIRVNAKDICSTAPLTTRENKLELSAEAKATFAGLLKKLTDVGASAATRYASSESQAGLLRSDIVTALQNQDTCRLKVFETLVARLLPASPPAQAAHAPVPAQVPTQPFVQQIESEVVSIDIMAAEIVTSALSAGEPLITQDVAILIRIGSAVLGTRSVASKWADLKWKVPQGTQTLTFQLTGKSWFPGGSPKEFSDSCESSVQIFEGRSFRPMAVLGRDGARLAIASCGIR